MSPSGEANWLSVSSLGLNSISCLFLVPFLHLLRIRIKTQNPSVILAIQEASWFKASPGK
jgi:hypothetical protein